MNNQIASEKTPALMIDGVCTRLNGIDIHTGVDMTMNKGEILAVVGSSGAGKSVLLRAILGLIPIKAGQIKVFGRSIANNRDAYADIAREIGVLFQNGALFSSLTVLENIMFPMRKHLSLKKKTMAELAMLRLEMAGLSPDDAKKYPTQLSGGMVKRAALARSLALDPKLVFLDEPTSGLDPISAGEFDENLRQLQATMGLSVFMITHDLDSIAATADRIAILAQGKMLYTGILEDVLALDHPWIKAYFHGQRTRFLSS